MEQKTLDEIYPKISEEASKLFLKKGKSIGEILENHHYQKNDNPFLYGREQIIYSELSKGVMMLYSHGYIQNCRGYVCLSEENPTEIGGSKCLLYRLKSCFDAYSNIVIEDHKEIKAVHIITSRNTVQSYKKCDEFPDDKKRIHLFEKEPLLSRMMPFTNPMLLIEFYAEIPDNFDPSITMDAWTFSDDLRKEFDSHEFLRSTEYNYILHKGSLLTEEQIHDFYEYDLEDIGKFVTNFYTMKITIKNGVYNFPCIPCTFISDISSENKIRIIVNFVETTSDKILSSNNIVFYADTNEDCMVSVRVNIVDHKYYKTFFKTENLPTIII